MLWKLLGSLLLVLTGAYISTAVARFERRRVWVLDGYLSLLAHIKGQIDCFALPVTTILQRTDPSILAACMGAEERHATAQPPALSLACAGSPLMPLLQAGQVYLTVEGERLLTAFAGELGQTNRLEQVARCDYYIAALAEERRRMADALLSRVRVGNALCLASAALAALLLW